MKWPIEERLYSVRVVYRQPDRQTNEIWLEPANLKLSHKSGRQLYHIGLGYNAGAVVASPQHRCLLLSFLYLHCKMELTLAALLLVNQSVKGTSCFHGLTIATLFKKYSCRMLAQIATESPNSYIKTVRFVERSKLWFSILVYRTLPRFNFVPYRHSESIFDSLYMV